MSQREFSGKFQLRADAGEEVRRLHGRFSSVREFVQDVGDAVGGTDGLKNVVTAHAASRWYW